MSRGLDKQTQKRKWDSLKKDWYTIYQWSPTARCGYTEWIAEWIVDSFDTIDLVTTGLRQRSFRTKSHRGQIAGTEGIKKQDEKPYVRAMFNRSYLPLLGRVVDYEIPLKDNRSARHGKLDLFCVESSSAVCIEAKQPNSPESILKAIIEAFTYTSLIATRRDAFLKDFQLPVNLQLTPAVLIFSNTPAARQLKECTKYQHLLGLVEKLNSKLKAGRIVPIRFYVVENDKTELKSCLMKAEQPNGDVKAVFCGGFELNIVEYVMP